MCIPDGHWYSLDFMISQNFTTLDDQIEIAWEGWRIEKSSYPEVEFSTAFGFAIQEAHVQFETWMNGFANDSEDER